MITEQDRAREAALVEAFKAFHKLRPLESYPYALSDPKELEAEYGAFLIRVLSGHEPGESRQFFADEPSALEIMQTYHEMVYTDVPFSRVLQMRRPLRPWISQPDPGPARSIIVATFMSIAFLAARSRHTRRQGRRRRQFLQNSGPKKT
jgi:hypothetical protein